MAYYVFSAKLKNQIAQAIPAQAGFFDFKPHQKLMGYTDIPASNTDSTTISEYRTVFILETVFSEKHSELRAQAEKLAEFFSDNPEEILVYLQSEDKP
jgi:hypothetical protein